MILPESTFALECELIQQLKTSFRTTAAWSRLGPVEKTGIDLTIQKLANVLYVPDNPETWTEIAGISNCVSQSIVDASFPALDKHD